MRPLLRCLLALSAATLAISCAACHASPQAASVQHIGDHGLTATIKLTNGTLSLDTVEDTATHASVHPGEVFVLMLQGGRELRSSDMIDVQTAFELPPNAKPHYAMHSPWAADSNKQSIELEAHQPHTFELQPFEVLSLQSASRP